MGDNEFVERVRDRIDGTDEGDARAAADAVLETLADRITGGEADDIVVAIPGEVGEPLANADHDAAEFDPDEFERRVERRLDDADVDPHAATVATLAALDDTVRDEEIDDLRDQLPPSYGGLLDETDVDGSD